MSGSRRAGPPERSGRPRLAVPAPVLVVVLATAQAGVLWASRSGVWARAVASPPTGANVLLLVVVLASPVVLAGAYGRQWWAGGAAIFAVALTAPPGWEPAPTAEWLLGGLVLGVTGQALVRFTQAARRLRTEQSELVMAHREQARSSGLEREALSRQLRYWVTHDVATGLANRTLFLRTVQSELDNGASGAVLVFAAEGLAELDDSAAPGIADGVLDVIGLRLGQATRGGDDVGRLSSGELAVLLRTVSAGDAQDAGSRLVGLLSAPVALAGHTVTPVLSCGVALAEPGMTAQEVVRRARAALREDRGGQPVRLFAEDLDRAHRERLDWQAALGAALANGEFFCTYQPLVSARTGELTAVEALVRWRHPERGVVPPDAFIPTAEECGLIVPLGLHVLESACRDLRAWTAGDRADGLTVAVNLSARQLCEPGVVEAIRGVLWRSGLDPRRVLLEVTESLLVEDSEAAIATLWQLRGLGVRLAMDDFGTGYSSLSRLGDMPIDELKIDKSFTDRIGDPDHDSSALVAATVAMGHGLGLVVVAEGVETVGQAEFLRSVGCDLLQGYLFSRPVEAAGIRTLLHRRDWSFLTEVSAGAGPARPAPARPAPVGLTAPGSSSGSPAPSVPKVLPAAVVGTVPGAPPGTGAARPAAGARIPAARSPAGATAVSPAGSAFRSAATPTAGN